MEGMKTVLDTEDRSELAARIATLTADSPRLWGRMTPAQMLRHCTLFDRWIQDGGAEKQSLMGKIVGRAVLRRMLRPQGGLSRNMPTTRDLLVSDELDLEEVRTAWLTCLDGYRDFTAAGIIHDFFGPMTRQEVGVFAWQHADHHLRQFGA